MKIIIIIRRYQQMSAYPSKRCAINSDESQPTKIYKAIYNNFVPGTQFAVT